MQSLIFFLVRDDLYMTTQPYHVHNSSRLQCPASPIHLHADQHSVSWQGSYWKRGVVCSWRYHEMFQQKLWSLLQPPSYQRVSFCCAGNQTINSVSFEITKSIIAGVGKMLWDLILIETRDNYTPRLEDDEINYWPSLFRVFYI